METDIIVIGAGPCGAFAALNAAKLGANVTVFEEHSTVGIPSHCAGHLSSSGLKRLGLKMPSSLLENMIKGAIFFSPFGRQFSVRFSSPVICAVNRELFDQHLANAAAQRGVQVVLNSKVESLTLDKEFVKGVVIQKTGKSEKTSSSMVIDAEGVASTILKSIGLKPFDRKMLVKTVSAQIDNVENVENDCVEVYFGSTFADGFYAWMIPERDGTVRIGLATKQGNPKQCLDHFMHKHKITRCKLRKSRILHLSYHTIPLGGPISKTYSNGFLAVGDVASQVKSTTGGGVIMGLSCARIAGEVAAHAVKEGDFSESFLRHYEMRWKQEMGFDMRTMLFVRKLLNRLSDREMDKLFSVAVRMRLDEVLMQTKDLDFQGTELLRLARNPSLLATLAYFFLSAVT